MSGRFKKNELNYWPAEKKILAAIYGTEKLYPYSVAEEFILRKDYTTLRHLRNESWYRLLNCSNMRGGNITFLQKRMSQNQ